MSDPETDRYFEEVAERMRERDKTRYTGICTGCGDERTDLFLSNDPILCGDCGLKAMMLGMGSRPHRERTRRKTMNREVREEVEHIYNSWYSTLQHWDTPPDYDIPMTAALLTIASLLDEKLIQSGKKLENDEPEEKQ